MKTKLSITLLFLLAVSSFAKGQKNSKTDSAAVATTLNSLLSVCRHVDFKDPKTTQLGTFYKAAPFILYQGDDKKRAFKVFTDYSKAEDKKGVDEVCFRINASVNRDSTYKIIKYTTEKESEGLWHILVVSFKKNDSERKAAFGFLKIGGRFGLGDID
jgi:hypothetical protein